MSYGLNILQGLGITFTRLMQTYIQNLKKYLSPRKNDSNIIRQTPDTRGIFTVLYPEERLKLPERFRFLPMLIYEGKKENLRCTACGICAKVCPPQCIWIVQAKTPEGKPLPRPSQFYIDIDVCMNCGLCSEFCPFDAIKMDNRFELSGYERSLSHIYEIERLLVDVKYYASIHPTDYYEEEAKRKKR